MIMEQWVTLIFSSLNNLNIDNNTYQWRKSHGKAKAL